MDERIGEFIQALEKQLEVEDLSEEEVDEALGYYKEYLIDAYDEGKDMDEIFLEIGTPEKVAGMIKAGLNIARGRENPGLKSFAKVSGSAFRAVSMPFYVFLLSITIFLSYCMVGVFFTGAFLFCLAGCTSLMVILYQAFTMPAKFLLEIAGTIGIGFLSAGILLLFGILMNWCGRLFIRVSMGLIRSILNKPGKSGYKSMHIAIEENKKDSKQANKEKSKQVSKEESKQVSKEEIDKESKKASKEEIEKETEKSAKVADKAAGMRKAVKVLAIISAAGLLIFMLSGIPWRYFMIFNSMKPPITRQVFEYDPEDVNRIDLSTANAYIEVVAGGQDNNRIALTYEQPDWTDFEIGNENGVLGFNEKSNGRLPFFDLIIIHECVVKLTVSLPGEADLQTLRLDSTGGKLLISGVTENIDNIYATTLNGDIHMHMLDGSGGGVKGYLAADEHGIKINTTSGSIFIGGEAIARENGGEGTPGRKDKGAAYYKEGDPKRVIELKSTNGSIYVE